MNAFLITHVSINDSGEITSHESSAAYPLDNPQEVSVEITTPEGVMYTVTAKTTHI